MIAEKASVDGLPPTCCHSKNMSEAEGGGEMVYHKMWQGGVRNVVSCPYEKLSDENCD